ncbi:S-layer homology domain-containing protein, partial [Evtepia sp.]
CVAMLLSVMVMGTGAASFTDQDEFSDNYAEAAEVLTGMGIIQGYDDGSFLPQRNINRAQVATMIYRAATGDVTDSKISQFVGEDLFDDVNADDWFAGYVNYCGNAEYIKGFTPDTFGPYKQVTGYQVLAMILRAVGYDENNEYTGDQWTLRVAATAREQGLLDNLNPDTNLAEPATR